MLNDSALTAFDFFAGGGGASLGLHRAGINVLAALNHSPTAIETHAANFADAKHMLCDIRVQQSWGLGHADIMWASPDCTHHSIAKGGQSRDAKERALAEELPRFAYNLNVNCIMVENVKEFLDWGPLQLKVDKHGRPVLDKKGQQQWVPIKARKKEFYNAWVASLAELGFVNYEYRLLNAADFGVPQSRTRYFGIFTRRGVPINWPAPTHDKTGRHGLPKWAAVRGVLDLGDHGRSIFTEWDKGPSRKAGDKPAEKTLYRILAGLKKHVIGAGEKEYFDKRGSNPPSGKPNPGVAGTSPSPTIATCYLPDLVTPRFLVNPAWGGATRSDALPAPVVVARQDKGPVSVATAKILVKNYSGDPTHQSLPLTSPAGTVTCADHHTVATCMIHMNDQAHRNRSLAEPSTAITTSGGRQYLTHYYSGRGQATALHQPHPASTCQPHSRLITPVFVKQYNGGSDNCRALSLDGPVNVVPTENRFYLTHVRYLCGQYGTPHNTAATQACPPILTTPKQNLVTAFLAQSNGVSQGVSPAAKTWRLDTSSRTITTGPNQSLVQCLLQRNGTRPADDPARLTMPLAGQAPTLNTNGGNLCLMSYYGTGTCQLLCRPCPVVPTHDKFGLVGFVTGSGYGQPPYSWLRPAAPLVASRRHPYLVLALPGSPVAMHPADSPAMAELKAVCRAHGIADIYMRMLKVEELKLIMGFPADYYLAGGVTKQKEMLGNAVVPQVSEAIARAMSPGLLAARLRKLPRLRRAAINRWEQLNIFEKEVVA